MAWLDNVKHLAEVLIPEGTATERQKQFYNNWKAAGSPTEQSLFQDWKDQVGIQEGGDAPSTYTTVYSGGNNEYNPFTDPEGMAVESTSVEELQQQFSRSSELQNTFGDFNNYLSYLSEATPINTGANWWGNQGLQTGTNVDRLLLGEDLSRSPSQLTPNVLDQTDVNARKSGYQQWLLQPDNQELIQKYGIQPTITNSDGDVYKWTGSGYAKTVKQDDHAGFEDYVKAGIITGLSTGLGSAVGAASGLGGVGAGAVQGGVSAATSGLLSGSGLSFQDVATGAALGGLGGYLGDLAKASEASQLESLEELSNLYQDQGMIKSYEAAQDAINSLKAGSDFTEATVGLKDLIQGVQGVIANTPEIVWQPTDETDVLGDVQVQVPSFELPTEEGGGEAGSTEASQEEVVDILGEEDIFGDTTADSGRGQYVVVGQNEDGTVIVEDQVDGDIWIVPGEYGVGDMIPESDMVDAVGGGTTMTGEGTNTETEGASENNSDATQETEGELIFGGLPSYPSYPSTPGSTDTTGGAMSEAGETTNGNTGGGGSGLDLVFGFGAGVAGSGGGTGEGEGEGEGDGEGSGRNAKISMSEVDKFMAGLNPEFWMLNRLNPQKSSYIAEAIARMKG